MPRKVTPPSQDFPYHVTARSLNREPFPIPIREMWWLMEDYLFLTAHLYELQIHSFVLMPNHFHLLVSTPNANIGAAMNYFMRETARETSRIAHRINQTFGARHHKTLVKDARYFFDVYKYVYRNPVRARLVEKVEDYEFSTLHGLLGSSQLVIPIAEDTLLFEGDSPDQQLRWLNSEPGDGLEDEVRQGLRHPEFAVNTPRSTNRESVLLSSRL